MITLALSSYNIHVGDFWAAWKRFLGEKKYSHVFILVDEHTEKLCLAPNRAHFPENAHVISISAGEQHKNLETTQIIWKEMFGALADRQALLVNLGGGVIGDMGGFCAATFKRGFDFVQMPTTLLAQVDASIGGKLGIDFAQVKNSIGVFCNPKAVFIAPEFLATLPNREKLSGFAEIIKHALIADVKQWDALKKIENIEAVDWASYIVPSLKIKQHIVEIDPFEKRERKALNFGHTVGHAVESFALQTPAPLTHGEAIAVGMICELYLSKKVLGLNEKTLEDITRFILRLYGKHDLKQKNFDTLVALMQQDKKNEKQKINFSLIPSVGNVTVNVTTTEADIKESLLFYQRLIA